MANFGDIDETAAVYVISVAAEISGMHPQTLRPIRHHWRVR